MQIWLIIVIIVISLVTGWFTTTGVKSQLVRLGDIFIYGPLLIYASTQVKQDWLKIVLLVFGASTISYNLRNYIAQ